MRLLQILFAVLLLPVVCFSQQQRKKFSKADLAIIVGKWNGVLTNVDPKDDKTQTVVKGTLEVENAGDSLRLKLQWKDSTGMSFTEVSGLSVETEADVINYQGKPYEIQQVIHNGPKLMLRTIDQDEDSKENNKPAEIHINFTLSKDAFIIYKEVNYEGGKNFFMRSRYMFTKQ